MMTLSARTPMRLISSVQAIAAAPAPLTATLTSLSSRPVRKQALIRPAAVMIAVPCWSSWKTGMFIRSFSVCSMTKQSGAAMSSRLMPPKLGSSSSTHSMKRFAVLGRDFDVDRVDVGEALEQHRLAFHHRLGRQRAEIAEAEDRGAVGDDRDEIALAGVIIGVGRILGDRAHRHGDAGRISEAEVALRRHRLGGDDLDLAGPAAGVEFERFLARES